jgi:hypothetical protein
MGVFLIRNILNDKVFLAVGRDLSGTINRHKFQLSTGSHPNKSLQADWDQNGADSFAFEILDQVNPGDDLRWDQQTELESLEQLWLAKLRPFGKCGYNEPKQSREEKLRRIAARRLSESQC